MEPSFTVNPVCCRRCGRPANPTFYVPRVIYKGDVLVARDFGDQQCPYCVNCAFPEKNNERRDVR